MNGSLLGKVKKLRKKWKKRQKNVYVTGLGELPAGGCRRGHTRAKCGVLSLGCWADLEGDRGRGQAAQARPERKRPEGGLGPIQGPEGGETGKGKKVFKSRIKSQPRLEMIGHVRNRTRTAWRIFSPPPPGVS